MAESKLQAEKDEELRKMTLPEDKGQSLPAGWEKQVTPEGKVFYLDHNTKLVNSKVGYTGKLIFYPLRSLAHISSYGCMTHDS